MMIANEWAGKCGEMVKYGTFPTRAKRVYLEPCMISFSGSKGYD